MRCARTRVLPEPAPARMSSGPSVVVTARACSGFRRETMLRRELAGVLLAAGRGCRVGERPRARQFASRGGDHGEPLGVVGRLRVEGRAVRPPRRFFFPVGAGRGCRGFARPSSSAEVVIFPQPRGSRRLGGGGSSSSRDRGCCDGAGRRPRALFGSGTFRGVLCGPRLSRPWMTDGQLLACRGQLVRVGSAATWRLRRSASVRAAGPRSPWSRPGQGPCEPCSSSSSTSRRGARSDRSADARTVADVGSSRSTPRRTFALMNTETLRARPAHAMSSASRVQS